jgi:hypothetical protein
VLLPILKVEQQPLSPQELEVSLVTLRLKAEVTNGIKIWKHPLIIKDGIPSAPTLMEGLRRLMALLSSTVEIGIVHFNSVFNFLCAALNSQCPNIIIDDDNKKKK